MVEIEIAAHAGACYGVERALAMARAAARDAEGPVRTLGPLIHNPLVVDELAREGVSVAQSVSTADAGTLILRTHGVVPRLVEQARAQGLHVLDATCPYVKRAHAAARRLVRQGFQLLVVGEAGHPEVEGILGAAGDGARVVSRLADLDGIDLAERIGVVVQTTQTIERLQQITDALLARAREVCVVNTICAATTDRQRAARALAEREDVMIVIGGKNSGNTRRLAEISAASCPKTHHIEDVAELESSWFYGARLVGITAGASTPAAHIDRAVAVIGGMCDSA
ncbi:hydroxymethylbutenyl pyrophosphate reductase [Coriobacterium glomerans PW2]|uniref:4-hydroxy-3-methylbut-2-enyl diphosphate reductase n=1 Tax=Coriobacterium glomerans (strain ATCC 49209 / DSM 20642 / JCM 10262 / PW2) TaxID=700015 RepID=F2N9J0_CORGP|nr:4-hydroxy-3-methylbut-2-enyl diphosphate reductase [Coriobacterium glomerans]AEB07019.1 hydroxymethylbutenyl pyrophosphate reductase [Coriobacterium glomerans PW2]